MATTVDAATISEVIFSADSVDFAFHIRKKAKCTIFNKLSLNELKGLNNVPIPFSRRFNAKGSHNNVRPIFARRRIF